MSEGTWDARWEALFSRHAWGRYPPEPVIRAFVRAFPENARRSARVLDLGCGPGANTWFLSREGFRVSAIDGSHTAIEQNRARLAAEGLEADLRAGDFTTGLPWPADAFDAVLDAAALYANPLASIERALGEVERVLRPGGLVVSVSFTDRTWGYGRGKPGVDPGGFVDVDEGPLAGKGYVQFLGRNDVERLFGRFAALEVERASTTRDGGAHLIEQWVVTARKRGAP